MITGLPINFLKAKILDLQSALFFPDSSPMLKIPTHVVTNAQADEEGQIWFFIPRPAQHLDPEDCDFPARMEFFKKGKGFYLKIQGKAKIVHRIQDVRCPQILEEVKKRIKTKQLVAIRIKIQTADYFERVPVLQTNWILSGKNQFLNWLFNPQYNQRTPQLITIPITIE